MKQLLYRSPGPVRRHGVMVEIGHFPPEAVEEALGAGWRYTPRDDAPEDVEPPKKRGRPRKGG